MNTHPPDLVDWKAPEDFQQVDSAVDGITVYAPRPEDDGTSAPKTYKCPNCGASTRFDVAAGGVVCEHCGFSVSVDSAHVGRRAKEFEFTLETLRRAEHGWGMERRELHCDSCGAELVVAEGALTATCAFCASNKVNVRTTPSDKLRPRFLVPFKMKIDTIHSRVREWLGKGWYHPAELTAKVLVDRFVGIYLPFWTFDARIYSRWRAQLGHTRTYRDRNGNRRTKIEWRWRSGQVTVDVDDYLFCGSSHISARILGLIQPFNLHALETYSPDYLAGWHAQAYDINLPDAWEAAKTEMRERAKDACYRDINNSHVRNFSMNADFADESWRYILLPVYLASYEFEDTVFQVMVNGQTGKVAGQKPVAWWKIWLAVAGMLAPGFILGLIGLPLLLLAGIGAIPLVLGFVLLVIGIVLAVVLYRKAMESEAA